MAPNLVDLVNEYYEAKKPYSKILRETHQTPSSSSSSPSQDSAPKSDTSTTETTSAMVPSQQEPLFSISPRIPNGEIYDVLKKLEAAKIEYKQWEKASAAGNKKGKAPAEKPR